jgi:hypothetical protein
MNSKIHSKKIPRKEIGEVSCDSEGRSVSSDRRAPGRIFPLFERDFYAFAEPSIDFLLPTSCQDSCQPGVERKVETSLL